MQSVLRMRPARALQVTTPASDILIDRKGLVVDDNASNNAVLCQYLIRLGIVANPALSAAAALAALEAAISTGSTFEIVLIDYRLPDCDGLDLYRRPSADSRFRSLRLVMLTSPTGIREMRKFPDLRDAAYLLKPVWSRQLGAVLTSVVGDGASDSATQRVVGADPDLPVAGTRILLAEDNVINQKVAGGLLEKLGFRVDIVGNGAQVLHAWRSHDYRLIIMDCQMPVMDGYQATAEIRKHERERGEARIPIIALTADAIQGTDLRCLEAGMDEYLTKPLDRYKLTQVLGKYCSESPAPHASAADDHASLLESDVSVDWASFQSVTDGDPAFALEVVQIFIAMGDSTLEDIRSALSAGDLSAVQRASHSLLGATATIGARRASLAAARLEDAARAGAVETIADLKEDLRRETRRAATQLRSRCA